MAHSNQVREFLITSRGIVLQDVYVGPEGVLTGSLRAAPHVIEGDETLLRRHALLRKQREIERRRAATRAQIAALKLELEAAELEAGLVVTQDEAREHLLTENRTRMR